MLRQTTDSQASVSWPATLYIHMQPQCITPCESGSIKTIWWFATVTALHMVKLHWTADRSRRLPVRRMHPPGSRQAPLHSPHLHRAKPLLLPIPFPSSLSLTLLLAGLPLTLLLAGLVPQVMLLARLAAHSRQAACSLVPLTCSSFSQICCSLQCIQQQGYHQQVCKVSTRFSIPQSCKEHAVCCSAYCLLCYNTVSQLRS